MSELHLTLDLTNHEATVLGAVIAYFCRHSPAAKTDSLERTLADLSSRIARAHGQAEVEHIRTQQERQRMIEERIIPTAITKDLVSVLRDIGLAGIVVEPLVKPVPPGTVERMIEEDGCVKCAYPERQIFHRRGCPKSGLAELVAQEITDAFDVHICRTSDENGSPLYYLGSQGEAAAGLRPFQMTPTFPTVIGLLEFCLRNADRFAEIMKDPDAAAPDATGWD